MARIINDIEMHSMHNEEKSVIAQIFISTLNNNMTSISFTNIITHLKMKPLDGPQFKVGYIVRISKYKIITKKNYKKQMKKSLELKSNKEKRR